MDHEVFYSTVAVTIPVLLLALVFQVGLTGQRMRELRFQVITSVFLGFAGEIFVLAALFSDSDTDIARGLGLIGALVPFAMFGGALTRYVLDQGRDEDRSTG